MKCTLVLVLALFGVVFSEELYTTENDDFDIEALIKDKTQLKAFADCFTDKGDCTAISADFKKDMTEVFQLACSKCTAAQKHILKRFIEALEKQPSEFQAFKTKYDPENKFFAPLQAAIRKA